MRVLQQGGRWIAAALIAALVPATAAALLILADPPPVRALRDLVFDNYQRLAPRAYDPAAPVRAVVIDEESLSRIGQWPWPRERLAELADRLGQAGAAVIALDILLAEPDRAGGAGGADATSGDTALALSLARQPVVIGLALADRPAEPVVKAGFAAAGDDPQHFVPRLKGAVLPIPALVAAARGLGALNWVPDRDLVVRRVPTLFAAGGKLVPSLVVEALRVAQGASTIVVKSSNASGETAFGKATGIVAVRIGATETTTEPDGSVRVRYAGTRPERHIAAWRVLDGSADLAAVDGAIVLVGASAAALADVRATPLEAAVAGVDIHAEVIEHILSGGSLKRPDYAPGLEAAAVVVGCLLAGLIVVFLGPLAAAGIVVALLVLVGATSWFAFVRLDLLLDPALPAVGVATTFAIATVGALRRSDRDKRRIREAFGRYLSPAIVEVLAADPSRLKLGGEMRPITVLFSDVRGFTARSEDLSAEDVVRFLNAVHAPMTDEVLKSRGTLDKFIGDGLMAFWNAPLDTPDHVRACLTCALAMQAALAPVDRALAEEDARAGRPHLPLAIGIGIHTGVACVGNVGSARRFDYSAIGDTVNTAARIEQASKTYGVPIIVSQEVTQATPDFAFLHIDDARLRGRQQASGLYALLGDASAVTTGFHEFRILHERALAACIAGSADADLHLGLCERHPLGAGFAVLYQLYRDRLAAHAVTVSAIMDDPVI